MKIALKILLPTLLIFQFGWSQNVSSGKVKGVFLDSNSQSVKGVTIVLVNLNQPLNKLTVYSDDNGFFEIKDIPFSNYEINTSFLGFVPYKNQNIALSEGKIEFDLQTITLILDKNTLKEVVIKTPPIERKADKTIVNVEAFIANAGGSALEALARSPGVSVDQNGLIQLLGKSGVMIFIDDKPTYLAGAELESYLRSMPASNLKQIELMTNPPAKYDAAGNAGIINLRTKRSKLKGFNGSYTLNFGQGKYARSNNNANLNFNTKKLNFFSNAGFAVQNGYQDLNINRITKNPDLSVQSNFAQNSYIRRSGTAKDFRLGADYYFSDKTTFGIVTKLFYNPSENQVDNKSKLSNNNNILTSQVFADNNTKGTFKNGSVSLNVRHQLDSLGSNITFDADYLAYENNNNQLFKNDVQNPNGISTYNDILTGNIPLKINIIAFKTDYTRPLKNNANFSAGLKSSLIKTDNIADYLTTINNITTPNYNLSNTFFYNENINAAYINYDKSFKKLSLQFGLRLENTISEGNQLGNPLVQASSFKRNYTNFFPTVFFSYKLDSIAKNQLTFSYGKRIDRPFYKDLNPFISPLDQFTIYSGNPFLLPTFSNNFSLGHIFKNNFSTTLNYSITTDAIQETIQIQNGLYVSMPGNIGSSKAITLSLNGNFEIQKWWSLNANSEVGHITYKSQLYNEQLNSKGTYFVFRGTNSFIINKTTSAELGGEYTSDFVLGQIIAGDVGFLNIGFRKKILQQKGSLRINLSDVLYTRQFRGVINNLTLTDAKYNSQVDTRVISFTFSYQFGNSEYKRQKYNGKGSENEQNRVKT